MSWSKNNRACKTTWSTLLVLEQTRKTFDKAGTAKMSSLTYFNPQDTNDVRRTKIALLVRQIDNIFLKIRQAKRESGVNKRRALAAMGAILRDKNKTIADLADVNDANYDFLGEEP